MTSDEKGYVLFIEQLTFNQVKNISKKDIREVRGL